MLIDTTKITNWRLATKTRPIKAKPIVNFLLDMSIIDKLLLDTLEGREKINPTAVICLGESGDIWQQSPGNLFNKYNIHSLSDNGWMICYPKPENTVNCIEVTSEMCNNKKVFTIIGLWGESIIVDNKNITIQHGIVGDFICQNTVDPIDVWIVKRKIFDNTYSFIEITPDTEK